MDDLQKALGDLSSIRHQLAVSTQFRGVGPATLAATAAMAFIAAAVQAAILSSPAGNLPAYLTLWIATAILGSSLAGVQMVQRTRRMHSGLSNEMLRIAVAQFLPAVGAGALVTFVLVRSVPSAGWMLPGLWQVIFSLGVFASCRFLPRPMLAVATWYLLTGLACLALGDLRALAPWTMGLSFATGQLLAAAVLYFATPEPADEV